MNHFLRIISISLALATGIVFLIYFPEIRESLTMEKALKEIEFSDQMKTGALIDEGRPEEALVIITDYIPEIQKGTPQGKKWLEYLVQVHVQKKEGKKLAELFATFPKSLSQNEKASLLAGSYLIAHGHTKDYEVLRFNYRANETHLADWFFLDADSLIQQGKPKEAEAFLNSRYFEGKEDANRLLRLALLNINDHPKFAWSYLDQALKKDSDSSDLRIYRAHLLDSVNKSDLALTEFENAIRNDPENRGIKDDASALFMKNPQHKKTERFLTENLKNNPTQKTWIYALFFNKTITPIKYSFHKETPPMGPFLGYIEYLNGLKPYQFWNESEFVDVSEGNEILKHDQTGYWLRILNNLSQGREEDALTLIKSPHFKNDNWNPLATEELARILNYRIHGSTEIDITPSPTNTPLLTELRKGELSTDTQNLLKSPFALSIPFIQSGWMQGAMQIYGDKSLPEDMPEWVYQEVVQNYHTVYGNQETIKFIKNQANNPTLLLFLSNLYLNEKQKQMAIPYLKELSLRHDEIGKKAAEILSGLYFEAGDFESLKNTIGQNSLFYNTTLAKELLARAAVKEKNEDEALKLYNSIQNESDEALSYLAKKAFESEDYHEALRLTNNLLENHPDSKTLQANKEKILEHIKTP